MGTVISFTLYYNKTLELFTVLITIIPQVRVPSLDMYLLVKLLVRLWASLVCLDEL